MTAKRTFKHIIAGANTIMPDGTKLEFFGAPGGIGYFVTDEPEKIEFLAKLSKTSGSQIFEVDEDKPLAQAQLQQDTAEALADSRRNTVADANPNIAAARANLGRTIAQTSDK